MLFNMKKNPKYAVIITFSFNDKEIIHPFNSVKKAKAYLKKEFDRSMKDLTELNQGTDAKITGAIAEDCCSFQFTVKSHGVSYTTYSNIVKEED